MEQEIYTNIIEYENLYKISNYGNVLSLEKKAGNGGIYKEKILKFGINSRGYLYVNLCKNAKIKKHLIHRLVGQHFIKNLYNKPCINHIDCNKQNNYYENLEWCTYKENTQHAILNGRFN